MGKGCLRHNLAAQSHVKVSFEVPEYRAEVDGIGVLRFLDEIKKTGIRTKFYQASSSELWQNTLNITCSVNLKNKDIMEIINVIFLRSQ